MKQKLSGADQEHHDQIKSLKRYIFEELEAEVDQNVVHRKDAEIKRKNLLIANDNLIPDCITHAKHIEQTTALLTENENLKVQVHNKMQSVTTNPVKLRCSCSGVNSCTDASRSQPRSNTKKNRILPAKSGQQEECRTDRPLVFDSATQTYERDRSRGGGFCEKVSSGQVYYVEGLGHNLFSVGQFCDSDLEVAFRNIHNGVVKRQNRTLIEAARTMLIFSKAPMFLWAEAVATACYTQNRSLIHTLHNKTPYELVHDKKPNLALCYPTINSEDLENYNQTADIRIFSINSGGTTFLSNHDQEHLLLSRSSSSSALQSPCSHQGVAVGSTIIEDNPFAPNQLDIISTNDDNPFVAPPLSDTVLKYVNTLGYPSTLSNVSVIYDRPRHHVLHILWGIIHSSNIDYAERIWEEFVQSIQTFLTDRKNLATASREKKKTAHLLILSEYFGMMPIPDALLTDEIKGSPYFSGYVEYVAEYQCYLDEEHDNVEKEEAATESPKAT
ncbi:retrovirus-related pol polyprotein from transposon TNT 1-94 [Tanacetum coccineum]